MMPVETSWPILFGCRKKHVKMDLYHREKAVVVCFFFSVMLLLSFSSETSSRCEFITYIRPRELLVVGEELVGDVGGDFFSLEPELHPAALQNLVGQL